MPDYHSEAYKILNPEPSWALVLSPLTLDAVQAEATRAHLLHGPKSMLGPMSHDARNSILVEEVGEVARELNEARLAEREPDWDKLEKELIQAAAMCLTWIEAIAAREPERQDR